MKDLLIVITWAFLAQQSLPAAPAAPVPGSKLTVFILAGQSNAVGYNHLREYHGDTAALAGQMKSVSDVLFWPGTNALPGFAGKWIGLRAGVSGIAAEKEYRDGCFGPEIGFALRFREQFPDRELAIIKFAEGATGIARSADYHDYIPELKGFDDHGINWSPPEPGKPAGTLYTSLLENVSKALNDLIARGIEYEIGGFIWMQGEHEAGISKTMAGEYDEILGGFILSVRKDLGIKDLPFLIGEINSHTWAFGDLCRERQARVCKEDPKAVLIKTIDLPRKGVGNLAHFDADGMLELGERFGWAASRLLSGGTPMPSAIPFPAALEQARVTLTDLKDGQRQGLLLGNGDLYGLVWEKEGRLFMRLTKNDIWDARMDVSRDGELPRIDIASGAITGPTGAPHSYSLPYPQPRCALALDLGPLPPSGSTATLDPGKARLTLVSDQGTTVVRILHDRNVVLIEGPEKVSLEPIRAETLPEATTGCRETTDWLHMALPGDIDYPGMEYAAGLLSKGNTTMVSLFTSFDQPGKGVLDQAIALVNESMTKSSKSLIDRHEAGWTGYWSRSGVQLQDSVLQRWWYRMLYYAGAVTKAGTAPVNLMPPLATDETPWHSDFHHNYNSWQAFWPLPAANHTGQADPWISYLNTMIPRFQFLAKETFNCEGIYSPISSFLHEPDPAVCKSLNKRQISFNPWGLTIGCNGMNVQNAWQMYLCDPDSAYLLAKIYPIIRESALFYLSFMEKCHRDSLGKVILGPSYSPEHGVPGIANCPFDIAYVRYTLDACIRATAVVKTDDGLAGRCAEYLELLPGYPVATDPEGLPVVVDWEGCRYNEVEVHNITVPAAPVFPCDQVTWFSPEGEKELFRRTIRQTRHNFNNSNMMFNIAKARLSMPEAVTDARDWYLSRERPNGFFEWQGHAHGTYMAEMIGVVGLIDEFLLQSAGGIIRFFPCWPDGQEAEFAGLLAEGGFTVAARWKEDRVVSATIGSRAGNRLTFLSPWEKLLVNGKEVPVAADGTVTLETIPGTRFTLKEKF